jgi:hypothetical protein
MDAAGDLRLLLVSRHPLILARADDEARFMSYLREAAGTDFALWTWSSTRGLSRDGLEPQANTQTVATAMGFIAEIRGPGVFVFHDAEPALEEHASVRAIKERALEATPEQTVILTGPTISVPDELKGLALLWKLAPPSTRKCSDSLPRRWRSSGFVTSRRSTSPPNGSESWRRVSGAFRYSKRND